MKPLSTHDPLDDLIAAALQGELTPEERTQFEARLSKDPAARAAYQEAQAMHDLLGNTFREVQPDPNFEQRMVSGVRRKIQDKEKPRESAWESVKVLWVGLKGFFNRRRIWEYSTVCVFFLVLAGIALGPITRGIKQSPESRRLMLARQAEIQAQEDADASKIAQGQLQFAANDEKKESDAPHASGYSGSIAYGIPITPDATSAPAMPSMPAPGTAPTSTTAPVQMNAPIFSKSDAQAKSLADNITPPAWNENQRRDAAKEKDLLLAQQQLPQELKQLPQSAAAADGSSVAATPPVADVSRKLIRNAQLDLEVKSFLAAMDQISALTKAAGGYVDTSNSQKGGNGKLHGIVVVKVLPQNLDDFLFKLRDLGQIQNQSVSTEDVTKDYYDTAARLENSRKMEEQLQDLLKHANSKVSDLLQVERELGRVRGEIEQMQGTLKVYDFQVQYATVTMQVAEKDLNQAAAYLLKEQDDFSLFATNVEDGFQKARQAADDFKAQVLTANLNHNSGTDVSAEMLVMVAPDQIESFLAQIRSLGRVANFTRQTQRVAKDGGDSDQPADQTLTDKDKVQVHITFRSDDETRKQVALVVVTPSVDDALDQAKTSALANAGTEILNSALNKTPQGQSTARLVVRVPGHEYHALLDAFRALGRTASFSLQRDDNSGPGTTDDDAPVIVSLALTDDDTPLQRTEMQVLTTDVDNQAQQIKKDAAAAGVQVKASSFERQPDGTEVAQMTFRLPMSKYAAFVEGLKKIGKVESLTVQRQDQPDQARTDDSTPAEISLQIHNQRDIVTDDNGLWATVRATFGDGVGALLGSVRMIGVIVAFLAPWVITLGLLAWVGRRIYLWRKK